MKLTGENRNILLKIGIPAVILFASEIIILGGIKDNYNSISQTVSEIGSHDSSLSLIYNMGVVLFWILIILFATGLFDELKRKTGIGITGLFIIGIANIIGGLFPLDLNQPSGIELLTGWFLGQTVEAGVGGLVAGLGFKMKKLRRLTLYVFIFVLLSIVITITLKSSG